MDLNVEAMIGVMVHSSSEFKELVQKQSIFIKMRLGLLLLHYLMVKHVFVYLIMKLEKMNTLNNGKLKMKKL